MIGLDTNVLLRLLVRDDPAQYAAAVRFVKDAVSRGETLFINRVVIAELAWALARTCRRSRNDIALAIEQVLVTAEFEVEGSPLAWAALHTYKSTSVDFTDCLVGAVNRAAGCAVTVTFNRAAAKLETFTKP